MIQRKMVNEFVYIDVTNLYGTVLNLYSVSIGVAFGNFTRMLIGDLKNFGF